MGLLSFLRLFGKRRSKDKSKNRKARRPLAAAQRLRGSGSAILTLEPLESRELLNGDTPFIVGTLQTSPTLKVRFSESMNVTDATTKANYLLVDQGGNPVTIQSATLETTVVANDTVELAYNGPLNAGNFTLFVHGDQLHDADGDNRALAGPGQLLVANSGRNDVSSVNLAGDGTLGATGVYGVPPLGAAAANPVAVRLADLNGDGIPDLVVVNGGTNQVDIFQGQSAAAGGGFSLKPDLTLDLPAGANPKAGSLVVTDLSNDGEPDIAVANSGTSNVSVFINNRPVAGTFNFAPAVNYKADVGGAAVAPVALVAADINGDSFPDLVTANSAADASNNYSVSVLLNAGGASAGTFGNATRFTVGTTGPTGTTAPTDLAAGVLSSSNKTDLVVSGGNNNLVYLQNTTATGAGVPTFNAFKTIATGATTTSVAVGRIAAHIFLDIAATTNANGGQVLVFTNSGGASPSFTALAPLAAGANPTAVALADLDGNGQNDILVANNNAAGSVTALLNTTVGVTVSFAAPVTYATDGNPQGLALLDTNADNRPDLLVTANNSGNDVTLLRSTETAGPFQTGVITNATNATPIVITSANTLADGDVVIVRGVGGDTAANGTWQITGTTAAGFTLVGSKGNGTYTANTGTWISPDDLFRVSGDVAISGTSPTPDAVAVGDLNNDGLPDYVVANAAANTVSVFLSTGQLDSTGRPLYASPFTLATGNGPISVAIGDVNKDGSPDIVVANQLDNSVSVFVNDGTGKNYTASTVTVGTTPTQVVLGDFNKDGYLDLAVAHNGTGGPSAQGVTVVLNAGAAAANPNKPFQGQAATEFATGTPASALAVGDLNGDGNADLAVAADTAPGQVVLLLGDGKGNFNKGDTFATGVTNPGSLVLADMNLDGFADIVVASKSTGNTTGGIAVLLNQRNTGFGTAIVTPVLPGTGLASLAVTNVNQNVAGAASPDVFPDVIVGTLPGAGGSTIANVFSLAGNGDGTFAPPTPYQAGGAGAPTLAPSHLAATPSPLILVVTFNSGGTTVSGNLLSNGGFEQSDLSGEQGNLLGWQTFDQPSAPPKDLGSNGRWTAQTGTTSPQSLTPVPKPSGTYQAVLDEQNLTPFQAGTANPNSAASYGGSHALYQDFVVPNGTTSLTLTFTLYIDDTGANGFWTNTTGTPPPSLDWTTAAANQQVRVDIMDPNNPNQDPTNPSGNFLGVTAATGLLQNLFITNTGDPAVQYLTKTITLTGFSAGSKLRLRFASANNQGKLILAVDNVSVNATFADTTPPTLSGVGLRNPTFLGSPGGTTPHTTDPTIVGRVNVAGGLSNLAYVAFDVNNDGDFNGPDDFKIISTDALGNFTFTIPNLNPGQYTVGVEVVDRAGQTTKTTITFVYQTVTTTEWQAAGPGAIDTTGQGVDYKSVSGRVTAVVADESDLSGNTYYVGSANGGVWKTTDGGNSWTPLMDFLTDGSGNSLPAPIGALAQAPSDPLTLYAATGVADTAFDSRAGVGVFVTHDGGKTWNLAGNSEAALAGARISKLVVDSANPNIVYAAVASGGASGPGVYKLINNSANTGAWTDVMTPTAMGLPAGTALASVTDLVVDPFNSHRLLAGLGNIGLVAPSITGGVWLTTDDGTTWSQPLGGANVTIGTTTYAVPNSTLPNDSKSTLPNVTIGRVTVAISSEQVGGESTIFVLIGSPPANPVPGAPTVDLGSSIGAVAGLYKSSNNFQDFTKVMLEQDTSVTATHSFTSINLFGHDASYVGALAIDPADPNVVYVGGSSIQAKAGDPPDHALIRVDTGDMRNALYVDPTTNKVPNDGDDIQKALKAEAQGGFYDPATKLDKYTGEGVYWYDLVQKAAEQTGKASALPPEIHGLAFDEQGRLLVATEGGLWRGVSFGYGYDFSSGGRGILGGRSFNPPGVTLTALNGNLQIADLTSVAIDPSVRNTFYTTEAGTGTAATAGLLGWVSQGLTGPTVGGVNLGVPTADVVRAATPAPGTPAGTPTTLYLVWENAAANALVPETSTDGGATYTPLSTKGIPSVKNPGGFFPPLTVNPTKILSGGVYSDELLFGTGLVFLSDTSGSAWDSVPASADADPTNPIPLSKTGGLLTTIAIAPGVSGVFYAGMNNGEVFVTFNRGGDGWFLRDIGLPTAPVTGITVDPTNDLVAYVTFATSAGAAGNNGTKSLWGTTDGGKTWKNLSATLPAGPDYAVVVDPRTTGGFTKGHLYAGTSLGVWVSTDAGTSWQRLGLGMPNVPVVDLQFSQNFETLAAATQGRGVFTISTDLLGPRVTSIGSTPGVAGVTVTFSEPINPTTLTNAVITLTDPNGTTVTPTAITDLDPRTSGNGNGDDTFRISFAAASTQGNWHLTLQPTITDVLGNQMDQNQNGTNGETPGDVYTGRFLYQSAAPNTAPTLTTTAPTFPAINEIPQVNNGTDLATFVGTLTITDPDTAVEPKPVKGIAITGVDDTHGDWQFSTDGGATWTDLGTPSANAARLLEATANNRLRFIPAADFSGTSTFTFRAWDLTSGLNPLDGSDGSVASAALNGGTTAFSAAQGTATLTINFVNDAPSFNRGPDVAVLENSGAYAAAWATAISPGPPNESSQHVNFIVANTNPALFSVQPAISPTGVLSFTPAPNQFGAVVLTVSLHDDGGTANGGVDTSLPQFANLYVVLVNHAPSFTEGPDIATASAAAQSFPNWATNVSAGTPSEAGQALNFLVADDNPGLFTVQPAIDSSGTLTFTPAFGVAGSTNVVVQLHDNGGTANGGQDTSAAQTFHIVVNTLNRAPSFTAGPNVTVAQDAGTVTIPGWATNVSPGVPGQPGLVLTTLVSGASGFFLAGPTIGLDGTLQFTLSGQRGTATVTLRLQNNGGAANGGQNTSAPQSFQLTVTDNAFHGTPNEVFVYGAYLDLLGHAPSTDSLNFWVNTLEAGVPRFTVAQEITASAEYQAHVVVGLYHDLLNQVPTQAAINVHVQNLLNGATLDQEKAIFLSSPAYAAARGIVTPADFLNAIYQDVLGRPVDPVGLSYWGSFLAANGPATTALALLQTQEADGREVRQIFEALLGHDPPASAGVISWFVDLQSGVPDQQVVGGIAASDEYFTRRFPDFNEAQLQNWLSQVYQDALGRPLDNAGAALWLGSLNHGLSRQFVTQEIVGSLEFQTRAITLIYQSLLNRVPSPMETSLRLGQFAAGATQEDVKADIMASAEYYFGHGGGTDFGFLNAVYRDSIGVNIDGVGLSVYGTQLANGTPRGSIALEILETPNALGSLVQADYTLTLHRVADPVGLGYWVGQIQTGLRDEMVLSGLLSSREYFYRF